MPMLQELDKLYNRVDEVPCIVNGIDMSYACVLACMRARMYVDMCITVYMDAWLRVSTGLLRSKRI